MLLHHTILLQVWACTRQGCGSGNDSEAFHLHLQISQLILRRVVWYAALTLGIDAAQCPLFARKFNNSSDTVDAVLEALHSCEHPLHILQPCVGVSTAQLQ